MRKLKGDAWFHYVWKKRLKYNPALTVLFSYYSTEFRYITVQMFWEKNKQITSLTFFLTWARKWWGNMGYFRRIEKNWQKSNAFLLCCFCLIIYLVLKHIPKIIGGTRKIVFFLFDVFIASFFVHNFLESVSQKISEWSFNQLFKSR